MTTLNPTQEYLVREIRSVRQELASITARKNDLLIKYNTDKTKTNNPTLLQANLADNMKTLNSQIKKKNARLTNLTKKLAQETK